MADIIVKENAPLHQLIEKVEKHLDLNETTRVATEAKIAELAGKVDPAVGELTTLRDSLGTQRDALNEMKGRLDAMDKALPRGEKVYAVGKDDKQADAEAREQFARTIMDAALMSKGRHPRFNSFLSRDQTITDVPGNSSADIDTYGGVLVPVEQTFAVYRIAEQYGTARQLLKRVPMRSKTQTLPTNSVLPTVYWDTEIPTANQDLELAAPTASQVTFGKKTLTAHKLIAIDTLSIELVEDSVPNVAAFIGDLFGIAIAKEEDYMAFNTQGLSNKPFTGLLQTGSVGNVNAAAGSDTYEKALLTDDGYANLISMLDAVDENVQDRGKWLMSNSIVNTCRKVRDGQNRPLFGEMMSANPQTLFGYPYVRSAVMPKVSGAAQASKPFIIFGDFSNFLMGDRQQLAIDVSPHAAFKEAGLVMRVMERVAFTVVFPSAFATLTTAA